MFFGDSVLTDEEVDLAKKLSIDSSSGPAPGLKARPINNFVINFFFLFSV